MKRGVVVLLSTIVVGMLFAPGSASAEIMYIDADDLEGDLPFRGDSLTGDAMWQPLNGNWHLSEFPYLDMTHHRLSLDTDIYTFEMTLASELPTPWDVMPSGVKRVEWVVLISDEPWGLLADQNPSAPSPFMLNVTYDGAGYHAFLLDYVLPNGNVIDALEFGIEGSKFWVSFSGASIGDRDSFWYTPLTRVWYGGPDTYGVMWADMVDWNVVDDQMWFCIPWNDPDPWLPEP